MTTYELPPEPPVGESVRDALGRTWKHEGVNRWALKDDDADGPETRSWRQLFLSAPLALIEPDPWPTARTVAASVDGGAPQLLVIQDDDMAMTMTGALCKRDRNTLTNVVPVTVVPTAEWEAMATEGRRRDPWPSRITLADLAAELVIATDALGLD